MCECLFSQFGFFQTDLRNQLKSDKLHDLQEVKRSVYEKDTEKENRTSKIVGSDELPTLHEDSSSGSESGSSENDMILLDGEALDDYVGSVDLSEFSYNQVMCNWLDALGSSDSIDNDEEEEQDDNQDSLTLSRSILDMRHDNGVAYQEANPLPISNNPHYPQERLSGFRAKKVTLQQLFDNFIALPSVE